MDDRSTIEQVSRWLRAWSEDQKFIAASKSPDFEMQRLFNERAKALNDAARDLLTSDIRDLSSFLQADGTYPAKRAA